MSAEQVGAEFERRFGGRPTVIGSAPGRVNLVGEHTDYNGGEVLPIGIGRRTWVAGRPRAGPQSRVASAGEPDEGTFTAAAPERAGAWWDYVAGTAWALGRAGVTVPAADIAVWSDVPPGAGLSSSAALEVASATVFQALAGATVPVATLARVAWRAEAEFVGVACGIMDQFASALARPGHALHLWCKTAAFEYAAMSDAVLVFDTGVPRALRGSAFNTRKAECDAAFALLRERDPALDALADAEPAALADAGLPPLLLRRARHVVTETRRVRAAVRAMAAGGVVPGDLLVASHASLRDDFECSSAELNWFVDRALTLPGVRGAKLTGAGWGGCAIAVGEESALADAGPRLVREYDARFGRAARAWVTSAGPGAE